MGTYPNIKLDDYYFIDQGRFMDRLWWNVKVTDFLMPISPYFPTLLKRKKAIWKPASFKEVAKLVGLYDQEIEPFFEQHKRRLRMFSILLLASLYLLFMILFPLFVIGYFALHYLVGLLSININAPIAGLFIFLIFLWAYRVAFDMSALILERKFADSLCIMQIAYILLELSRPDVIRNRKTDLLKRMNFLANRLILMGMNYPGSDEFNKNWMYQYFCKISRFVRERERLVIAPRENSLDQLRQDFVRLGKMFSSGEYGSFDVQVAEIEKGEHKHTSLLARVTSLIIGIASIALPILALSFMITAPEVFSQLNINRDAVFYISIAWLLLALDRLFGMGIVESFLSLLKATKELR